jgi:hypothetical protein
MQTKNLDKLIFVNKNWPFDPQDGYMKPIDFASTCEMESNLTMELEVVFQDEIDHENFLDLNETF